MLVAVAPALFLGNAAAAADASLLHTHGVTQTLNLAVNADTPPLRLADGTEVRRAKVGLIDGPGNTVSHLAAAVLAIDGMLAQAAPGKPSYPPHRPGALLVHCRGGRSRSVTALALQLHLTDPSRFATLEAALRHLRERRGLGSDQPHPAMVDLAYRALPLLGALAPARDG
ncbi:MAG: protein phosphatase [Pseudomonadota bacterium]